MDELSFVSVKGKLVAVPSGGGASDTSIEEYDQDGWHVRKFSSGYCELLTSIPITIAIADWHAWGSSMVSTYAAICPVKSYPFTVYNKREFITVSSTPNSSTAIPFSTINSDNKKTPLVAFARGGTAPATAITLSIHIFTTGYWINPASLASTPTIIPEFPTDVIEAPASDAYDA